MRAGTNRGWQEYGAEQPAGPFVFGMTSGAVIP
jgi:hypothetical protein